MTVSIIIQLASMVMLMLLAVPGTQLLWKFGNKGIRKFGNSEILESEKRLEVEEIKRHGMFSELSKIAAALF